MGRHSRASVKQTTKAMEAALEPLITLQKANNEKIGERKPMKNIHKGRVSSEDEKRVCYCETRLQHEHTFKNFNCPTRE